MSKRHQSGNVVDLMQKRRDLLQKTSSKYAKDNMNKNKHDQLLRKMRHRNVLVLGNMKSLYLPCKFLCLKCGHIWRATPEAIIASRDCVKCFMAKRRIQNYGERVKNESPHNIRFIGTYINSGTPTLHKCLDCGHKWKAAPRNILHRKSGCPRCVCPNRYQISNKRLSQEEYSTRIGKFRVIGKYQGTRFAIEHKCRKGHVFLARPQSMLQGKQCPICHPNGNSSGMSTRWIKRIAKIIGLDIQHVQNGGERQIPGTKFKADGICLNKKIVFEFHGDAYHGNLNVYKEGDKPHPYDNSKTAMQLAAKTWLREFDIIDAGYHLVRIREDDYKQGYPPIIYTLNPNSKTIKRVATKLGTHIIPIGSAT